MEKLGGKKRSGLSEDKMNPSITLQCLIPIQLTPRSFLNAEEINL